MISANSEAASAQRESQHALYYSTSTSLLLGTSSEAGVLSPRARIVCALQSDMHPRREGRDQIPEVRNVETCHLTFVEFHEEVTTRITVLLLLIVPHKSKAGA